MSQIKCTKLEPGWPRTVRFCFFVARKFAGHCLWSLPVPVLDLSSLFDLKRARTSKTATTADKEKGEVIEGALHKKNDDEDEHMS